MTRKGIPLASASVRLVKSLRLQNARLRAKLAIHKKALAEPTRSAETERAGLLLAANERLLIAAVDADARSDENALQIASLTRCSQRDALTDIPTLCSSHWSESVGASLLNAVSSVR